MKPLPKEYLSRLIRAVVEFQLIEDNDKILIGLSGGKDSLFMAYALTELKNTLKKNFKEKLFFRCYYDKSNVHKRFFLPRDTKFL